jgi:hypothetical protein
VNVPTVRSLPLEQWIEEFERLRKLNVEIMKSATAPTGKRK